MKKGKWNNRIVAHKMIDPEQLLAHPNNWRVHPKAQRDALKGAINEVGFVRSVTISEDGTVIDGHLRVALALSEGQKEIPVEVVNLSEDEIAKALLTIDPLSAMAGADKEQLDALLREVETADAAVMQMLDDLAKVNGLDYGKEGASDADAEPQMDKADELRVKWGVERGQVWQLGAHRLMCGDSTSAEDVARLMGGEKADACISDPPYGINFDTDYTRFTIQSGKNNKFKRIHGDDKPFDPTPFLSFESVVLWGANYYADKLPAGTWLVWDKRFANGKAWLSDGEIAWMKGGTGVYIYSLTSQGFVRPEPVQHPTQKAVGLMKWCIEKAKAGNIVFEPFSGSGTTIIACEQLGRKCRAMEISPAYVAVALQRWADATGKTPTLASE